MLADKLCTGCTACYAVCPVHAVNMRENALGLKKPEIDEEKCMHCSLCEKACPVLQITKGAYTEAPMREVCAVQAIDESLRTESSSGGLFSLLAKSVLCDSGVVIGCTMTEDCLAAQHVMIDQWEDLGSLRGSKYVQSDLGNILRETVNLVKAGKKVLFSGTPCQVAGLHYALAEKQYDNLLTVDFICHGVPVPLAWQKYLQEQENRQQSKVKNVSFRDKRNGWKTYTLVIEFDNGQRYERKVTEDPYLRGFILNAYLRDSCYDCKMKGKAYFSDVTIADFWGVNKLLPEYDDNKGTSLAIVHTKKAMDAFAKVSSDMKKTELSPEKALSDNPSYTTSAPQNPLRKYILREMQKRTFSSVMNRYYGSKLTAKVRRRFYTMIER